MTKKTKPTPKLDPEKVKRAEDKALRVLASDGYGAFENLITLKTPQTTPKGRTHTPTPEEIKAFATLMEAEYYRRTERLRMQADVTGLGASTATSVLDNSRIIATHLKRIREVIHSAPRAKGVEWATHIADTTRDIMRGKSH